MIDWVVAAQTAVMSVCHALEELGASEPIDFELALFVIFATGAIVGAVIGVVITGQCFRPGTPCSCLGCCRFERVRNEDEERE